ncbi:hypothetical protein TPA0910_22460 [Streptomyces hygroscopicus subsp. sporocinereus]|uniref:Uncharacterized protein n=1 Tax=Streptomyces hygroscopicus TaxID=1912 RepID=A0ABQ3TWV0_STRHY|nr:hypothetical protein [Streptomyces hygroscopicus]GHJ27813.1 hypothetical protein TPA0910_22460 [Streptomyces hygroscopicus]
MSTRPRPHLKSLTSTPDQPSTAKPAPTPDGRSAPRSAGRQAVPTTGLPVADWLCTCGHHERARGRAAVTALAERVQVGVCPHRTTTKTEGRAA